jgi:hypothetical protein
MLIGARACDCSYLSLSRAVIEVPRSSPLRPPGGWTPPQAGQAPPLSSYICPEGTGPVLFSAILHKIPQPVAVLIAS